jgi:hypothetical protein
MKSNGRNEVQGTGGSFRNKCRAYCRKIKAQIANVKETICTESSRALSAPERLVQLALNEAEAAAWQTGYPHLFFPALAAEKVQAVAAWNAHQQSVRQNNRVTALAI